MRQLLIIFLAVGNIANNIPRALQNPAVRRGAATDLLAIAMRQRITPVMLMPRTNNADQQSLRQGEAYLLMLKAEIAERADLLQIYIEMMHGNEADVDSLVNNLYEEIERTAVQYVSDRKDKFSGQLTWMWSSDTSITGIEFNDEKRKKILRSILQYEAKIQTDLAAREKSNHSYSDVIILLQELVKKEYIQQAMKDLLVLYQKIPQLDTPVLDEEIATVRKLTEQNNVNFNVNVIIDKIEEQMHRSIIKDEGVTLQQKVHLADIFSRKKLIDITKKYYALTEEHVTDYPNNDRHLVTLNEIDLRNGVAVDLLDMRKEWNITWQQLRDYPTFSAAVGEHIQALGLDWQEFSKLVYPDDKYAAARFLVDSTSSEAWDIKAVINALQAHHKTLQDDDLIAAGDALLADLPVLFENTLLLRNIALLHQQDALTENNQPQEELGNNSPLAILKAALDRSDLEAKRWVPIHEKRILVYSDWHNPALNTVATLERHGLEKDVISERILTATVLDKLQRGVALDAHDIVAVRKLVNPENVTSLLQSLTMEDKERHNMQQHVAALPLTLQLESLAYTLGDQLKSEEQFLQALATMADSDSQFALLALALQEKYRPQEAVTNKSKRKRKSSTSSPLKRLRLALQNVLREAEKTRKKYLAPLTKQKKVEEVTPIQNDKANQEFKQKQAQLRAEQQAKQELEKQIFSLSKKIGKEDLPSTTPIWLRLRALLLYMAVDVQELGKRSAVKSVGKERCDALLADNSTVMPTAYELDSIAQALKQHTLNLEKRKLLSAKVKNIRLESMEIEMEAMYDFISALEK